MDSFCFTSFSPTTQSYFDPYEKTNLGFSVFLSCQLLEQKIALFCQIAGDSVQKTAPESWFSDLLLENKLWIHYIAFWFVLPFV